MTRIVQGMRILLAGGAFAGFGLGAPFVGLFLSVVWLLGGSRLERRRRCQRVLGRTFRFFHNYMNATGLIRYRPHLELPTSDRPRILVANHPTLVDVTAILGAYPEACCLVKSSIFYNPLFYLIMRFCGHICVRRGETNAGAAALEQAERRLDEGSDVLLFPEGTRSRDQSVGAFRAGAFAVAVHAEVQVVPVAVFSSEPVLKRGTPWYGIPARPVTLALRGLSPLAPAPSESIHSFSQRVREALIEGLTHLDPTVP